MSADVGAGGSPKTNGLRLSQALADAPEPRGVDRVLAESFWRPRTTSAASSRMATPARPVSVLPLPVRRF
jgi:hypothetical protein